MKLFKNAMFFVLTEALSLQALAEALQLRPAVDPTPNEHSRLGFDLDRCVFDGQRALVTMVQAYRDLPAPVINAEVAERVKVIEKVEGRKVGRKEKRSIKDETIFDLMPKAFVRHRVTRAIVTDKYIIVEATSSNRAEDLLSQLREALGSLKVVPIWSLNNRPELVMTHWVRESEPVSVGDDGKRHLVIGNRATLEDTTGGTVGIKNCEVEIEEVIAFLESGMHVDALGLEYLRDGEQWLAFTLRSDLSLRGVVFGDVVGSAIESKSEGGECEREATLLLMASSLTEAMEAIMEVIDPEWSHGGNG